MKPFLVFATATLTFGALLNSASSLLADNLLQLRPVGPSLFADPAQFPTFTLDLYLVPETNGQTTPPIRTNNFQSFLLYDRTKFEDVSFDLTIDNPVSSGGPTVVQRRALAPTNRTITSINLQGIRTLNSFDTPVDVLGSHPDGFYNVISLFDGNFTQLDSVSGLAFPAEGFKLGRYTFPYRQNANARGGTVVGFADLLLGNGQTLSRQEQAVVFSPQTPDTPLRLEGVFRSTSVPEPTALLYGLGLCIAGKLARSRRRRKEKE